MNLYRITPLEKKSIEYYIDMYEVLEDGSVRGFDVTYYYRYGQGFREEDNPVYKFESNCVHCSPTVGLGSELDDLCGVQVNFDDSFTEEEKEEIQSILSYETEDEDGLAGFSYIYDGDHKWQIEDDHIVIYGPIKIDLLDSEGNVLKENIEPEND